MPSNRKINCTLVRCNPEKDENACGLLQMEHSVPPEILYASYWYRSGTNNTMRTHLKGITEAVVPLFNRSDLRVLDIGCNDGTLLGFYPESYIKYGLLQPVNNWDRSCFQECILLRLSFRGFWSSSFFIDLYFRERKYKSGTFFNRLFFSLNKFLFKMPWEYKVVVGVHPAAFGFADNRNICSQGSGAVFIRISLSGKM